MAVPVVTCDADKVEDYSASSRAIQLGATATESPTSWEWTILHVPPGSTANVGTKGNFTNGVASIQNPWLEIDGGVDGGYCIQAVATNGDGSSNPRISGSQQLIIVRTEKSGLWLAPDYAYDWGERYLNPTLRALEVGGGGVTPFWEWNGTDLSQFDVFTGKNVSWYAAKVKQAGDGLPLIAVNSRNILGSQPIYDDLILFVPNDVVYPSQNYVVFADIGAVYSRAAAMVLGVRVNVNMGPYNYHSQGFFEVYDPSFDRVRPYAITAYGGGNSDYLWDGWQDSEYSVFSNADGFSEHIMTRIGIGIEGPKSYFYGGSTGARDLAIHRFIRGHQIFSLEEFSNPWHYTSGGHIAFGGLAGDNWNDGKMRFRNIRAYEIKAEGNPWI